MIVVALIVLLAFQQLYWSLMTHKLLDKLMSRNYHEYLQAQTPVVTARASTVHNEPAEDLGSLNDFRPL